MWNCLLLLAALSGDDPQPVLALSGRELMLDPRLVESMDGVELRMHRPAPAESALRLDRSWEGIVSGYFTVVHDVDFEDAPYRMWYRGRPGVDRRDGSPEAREVCCFAHSADGITWTRPMLGLHEVDGSRDNNVVLTGPVGVTHNFCPFVDRRPGVPAEQRYKGVGGIASTGLWGFVSSDGLHWSPAADRPLITEGALDSQNVVFWSAAEDRYLCFLRTWTDGQRTISRCTSADFLHWSALDLLDHGDAPREHLYTNQIQPYFRAPDLLIGTPARFVPGRRGLSAAQAKDIQLDDPRNYGGLNAAVSDAVLITGRVGTRFRRPFPEAFVRPGPELGNWVARANYPALGIVPTSGHEMSLFVQRAYGQQDHRLQRLVLRTDGFASVSAPYAGGEWRSFPFRFPALESSEGLFGAEDSRVGSPDAAVVVERGGLRGRRSLRFRKAAVLRLPETSELGESFTLSACVAQVPAGHRRLFSAYDGGSSVPGELFLDFDSDGDLGEGAALRLGFDGQLLAVPSTRISDWSQTDQPHTLTATWNRGEAVLFFDGVEVGRRRFPSPLVQLRLGGLCFGEDYPPTSLTNEPFLGQVDEVLVLQQALSTAQVRALHEQGVSALSELRGQVAGLLLDVEGLLPDGALADAWGARPERVVRLPVPEGQVRQRLWINYSTSAVGGLRFELQDEDGVPLEGFTLQQCRDILGDEVEGFVTWEDRAELAPLAGRTLRMRVWMKDADLFSLRFGDFSE